MRYQGFRAARWPGALKGGYNGRGEVRCTHRGACPIHMKRRLFALLLLCAVGLFACGDGERAGVKLQPAGQYPTATPTVAATQTPAVETSTPSLAEMPEPRFALSGRLLVLKGGQFLLYDLATGTITPLPTPRAYSPRCAQR
ncbi:MAG: hypothetical protein KatS3mg051_0491 [Anaerolineae bacterium]|nr:MAG: hypothetical protein KatS3mg051_0491 [Anaerolineae bacterium]